MKKDRAQTKIAIASDTTRIAALDQKLWGQELIGKQADDYLPALGLTVYPNGVPYAGVGPWVVHDSSDHRWFVTTDAPIRGKIVTMDGPWQKVE
ncbi:MAG: hypothetical protein NTW79_00615 [Candidatus Berkelbacteria bacterium]|nr:hypothetical protein [Candidatus Berkelbacteria bacterium]